VTKIIRVLLISITLIAIFSIILVGCGGEPASPTASAQSGTATSTVTEPAGPTAEEIVDSFLAATQKITTLKFDMGFDMTLEISGGSQPGKVTLQQNGANSVDVSAKKMAMQMDMSIDVPTQGNQNISAEIYSADGWLYTKMSIPVLGDQWYKMKLSDEEWQQQSGLSEISEFLKSPTKVELAGSETIKGVDCYVLNITPDMAVLSDWVRQAIQGQQTGLDLSSVDLAKTFKDFSIKEWISKDSNMLMQEQMAILAEITPADFSATGADFDKMTMNITGTITCYDYGQPINVVIP
jgi:hypothetical protein